MANVSETPESTAVRSSDRQRLKGQAVTKGTTASIPSKRAESGKAVLMLQYSNYQHCRTALRLRPASQRHCATVCSTRLLQQVHFRQV